MTRHELRLRSAQVALIRAQVAKLRAMADAHEAGMSLAEIGKALGVSKQAVHQALSLSEARERR